MKYFHYLCITINDKDMISNYLRDYDLFDEILLKTEDGMKITFTPDNVAEGDHFLIFSAYDSCTITIHKDRVPYWVEFDNDEPMLLENCPDSFYESILKNIK